VQHLLRPLAIARGRQFEHHPAPRASTSCSSTDGGRAIQISCRVEDQAGDGVGSSETAKGVENFLDPSAVAGRQLKNNAGAVFATFVSGAVDITGRVEDYTGSETLTVVADAEVMQHPLGPSA
jgi:hypothetical protein